MDYEQLRLERDLAEWQARRDYDPSRGTSLENHIINRRKRAALDHRRRECYLPRSLWDELRALEAMGEAVPEHLLPPCELTPAWEAVIPAPTEEEAEGFDCPNLIPCLRWLARSRPREAYVIGAHYGLGATLASLTTDLQVSEARIYRLRQLALRHLRQCLAF